MPGTANPTSGPYTDQDISNWILGTVNADGLTTAQAATQQLSYQLLYGGGLGTWARQRGNSEDVVLPSTLYVGTGTSTDIENYNGRGAVILLDVTTGSASGTVGTLVIQAKMPSGYFPIYTLVATLTTGSAAFLIYPGASSAGNWFAAPVQGVLPRRYNIKVVPSFATATLGYSVTVVHLV